MGVRGSMLLGIVLDRLVRSHVFPTWLKDDGTRRIYLGISCKCLALSHVDIWNVTVGGVGQAQEWESRHNALGGWQFGISNVYVPKADIRHLVAHFLLLRNLPAWLPPR